MKTRFQWAPKRHILLGVELDIVVQAHIQIVSGDRLHPLLPRVGDLHAPGVRLCQDRAVDPLEIFVVHDLQADDALVVAARKAQHLGGQTPVGVIPFEILVHLHPCQLAGADPIPDLLIYIGLDPLDGAVFLHLLTHVLLRKAQLAA